MGEYKVKLNDKKLQAVKELKDKFGSYKGFIFTDFRGLTVEQITKLRRELRKLNAEYKVVKNNFARIAFQEMSHPDVSSYLTGPTAIAMANEESTQVAKSLLEFAKETSVKVKGGLVEGKVFDDKQIVLFSKLPSRVELLASLMGTMRAPVQNLVYAMNGVTTKLVRTLQAVAEKKAS
ncbi:MAG: 50S ribosomal protein L10 [Spirochaetes bacterium]|nr:50S ribosomal protein L10 [Spirochaetota bacterium]